MSSIKTFILVLGPQGSGKSTQAKLLAEYLDYKYVSTGDLFREKLKENDSLSQEIKSFVDNGKLVPDDIVEKMLFLHFDDESAGYILDGYPRNLNQLNHFVSFLDEKSWVLLKAFFVNVGEPECVKRLNLRASIEKRADETESVIRERLRLYHEENSPLLEEYTKLGILKTIDGERSIEEIQSDIRSFFGNPF